MEEYSQEDLNEMDAELVRRLEQERWRFFEPSVKAEEFIKAIALPHDDGQTNFMTLFSAANGVGKTQVAANVVANILWPSENPFFQHDLFQKWPFPKSGRIVTDPGNVPNVIKALKFWFPHASLQKYTTRKNSKTFESIWVSDSGFDFEIMTYDQDPKDFEGPTLGFVWLDEPPPDAILKACISRLRMGGILFISATPLAGSAHLYDTFATGKTTIELIGPNGERMIYVRPVRYVEADVWSACKDVPGTRGHLSKADILKMIAEYDEDEQQARIWGKFQHLIGLVFKQWNRKVHVIKPFSVSHIDYEVWQMLDPHPRNPDAVLWVAVDKYGRKFVVDELYVPVANTGELAFKIKQKDALYRVTRRIADPSAFIVNQHDEDGFSLAERLSKKHGLTYEVGTKQRSQADARIREAIAYQEHAGVIITPPELYVFETCPRTIFEFEHYRWDEWTGKSADKKDRKEKPIDKDDHMIEDLGRFLIQEPIFTPYMPPQQHSHRSEGGGNHDGFDPY